MDDPTTPVVEDDDGAPDGDTPVEPEPAPEEPEPEA